MKTQITIALAKAALFILSTSVPGFSLSSPKQVLSDYHECLESIQNGVVQKDCPIITDVFDSTVYYADNITDRVV